MSTRSIADADTRRRYQGTTWVAQSDVNSPAPVSITAMNPTGKTTPITSRARPGLFATSSVDPPATTIARSAPTAMSIPPSTDITNSFESGSTDLDAAASSIVSTVAAGERASAMGATLPVDLPASTLKGPGDGPPGPFSTAVISQSSRTGDGWRSGLLR